VLQALYAAGARPASPGEFTQRAFLNGKLDLVQAEAVAELIHADSERAHFTSLAHLRGRYSELLEALREELLEVASFVELELDFSDEDVAFADRPRVEGLLHRAQTLVSDLLGSYQFGALVRDGVKVVLSGRPNAGKSTLLNRLVGYDRAIVSPTAGTTRDEIDAETTLDGLRFRFTDTAGLRLTPDPIEAEGVRRARARMQEADLVLYLYDASCGMEESEVQDLEALRTSRPSLPIVLLANKADLCPEEPIAPLPGFPFLALSAHTAQPSQEAFERLIQLQLELTAGDLRNADAAYVVTNQRHRYHLREALDALERAHGAFTSGRTGEVLALDLRVALHALGSITGAITNEDILSQIFSRFCIGK
jgi:tRNA modification GTPase